VTTLIDTRLEAGWHEQVWRSGKQASGIYLIQLRSREGAVTRKALLLK
jgi:hypothetical protein